MTTISTLVDTENLKAKIAAGVADLEAFNIIVSEFKSLGRMVATATLGRTEAYLKLATFRGSMPEDAAKTIVTALVDGGRDAKGNMRVSASTFVVYESEINTIVKAVQQPRANFASVIEAAKSVHAVGSTKQLSAVIVKLAREQIKRCKDAKKAGNNADVTMDEEAIDAILNPEKVEKTAEEKAKAKAISTITKALESLDAAQLDELADRVSLVISKLPLLLK